ncbi:hypothetical protein Sj15T_09790 [Sphingobium sp. TA15]|uniref:Uncharacterized protein n=1 Tax=Sphingobium indicum (strain DSM 16413 / CCM 7287 / MTCC 6362 / UT26 / NBRC 101211 / UT26S) TaxID=452662 RepID=D4Z244_SPHIU|nr:hypothetical protein [Sphingobium indicum]BAI96676.1 hypothetical protein SJA_C1-18420 [Sphingobium indicum UT26S]BDD65958.1 hypothetical protein Sj15T_09790 [Sphingobium sp. TA15]
MTILQPLTQMKREARRTMEANRFRAYVSREAEEAAYTVRDQVLGKPLPFSRWEWRSVAAPAHKQGGLGWRLRRYRLRQHMKRGGILIIIGPTRSGKTCLLQALTSLHIIKHFWSNMMRNVAVLPEMVPPSGLFAIDETHMHARKDIMRINEQTAKERRGFAMVFQSAESFRSFEISQYLANRKVLILQFLPKQKP